jgi:hypothetical protein
MKRHMFLKPVLVMFFVLIAGMSQFSLVAAAPPANDDFDSATTVPGLPFTDQIDTSEATTAIDDPDCVGNGPTVWYAYTPGQDMPIEANTFGSNYDTTLSVYTGTRGSLTQIACNDDTDFLQSQVIFDATANETYFFMIGAFDSGPGGSLTFNIDFAPPPPPPLEIDLSVNPIGYAKASSGLMTFGGVVTCTRPAYVDVYGTVKQRAGRLLIQGYFYTFIECVGETPWSATLSGENGIFKPGKATVDASAFADSFEGDSYAEDFVSRTVRFRGQRK